MLHLKITEVLHGKPCLVLILFQMGAYAESDYDAQGYNVTVKVFG